MRVSASAVVSQVIEVPAELTSGSATHCKDAAQGVTANLPPTHCAKPPLTHAFSPSVHADDAVSAANFLLSACAAWPLESAKLEEPVAAVSTFGEGVAAAGAVDAAAAGGRCGRCARRAVSGEPANCAGVSDARERVRGSVAGDGGTRRVDKRERDANCGRGAGGDCELAADALREAAVDTCVFAFGTRGRCSQRGELRVERLRGLAVRECEAGGRSSNCSSGSGRSSRGSSGRSCHCGFSARSNGRRVGVNSSSGALTSLR